MTAVAPVPPHAGSADALPDITLSNLLWERARRVIPGGTQTLAKGPQQQVDGVAPKYLRRGKGARVWDVDGNEYIDLMMGIGPLVLGYADPDIDTAIRAQLDDGITFSLMHPLEVEVAEQVRAMVPCAESVRFSKTGADVTSAAIRVARAFTNRSKVLCCGYHGWHDWYVGMTDRRAGVPDEVRDLTFTFDYNNVESLAMALDDDVAAVILEPVVFEEPANGFLTEVRALCTKRGALLVFDEMWTGFRISAGGAQQHYGVTPDLATFSKAVANGMPLSVLAGRADVMRLFEKDVFFYTTFGGEALSLAAAHACLRKIETHRVPEVLARNGERLRDGFTRIAAECGLDDVARCVGPACRTLVTFAAEPVKALDIKSLVQQELIRRGILWSGTHTLSFAHSESEIDCILDAYRDVLPMVRDAVDRGDARARLRGAPIEASFRRVGGFNVRPRSAPARLFSLAGQVAVVTGAAGLLGRQHVAALAQAGATVIAVDLDAGAVDAAVQSSAPSDSERVVAAAADVTNASSLEQLRDELVTMFGRIDVLVNNAAINDKVEDPALMGDAACFERYPLDAFRRVMDVNVTGVFLPSQILGAAMMQRGRGRIINVASTYALVGPDPSLYEKSDGSRPFTKSPAYPASKGAVVALTRYFATHMGEHGVTVNALVPGGVENGQDETFITRYASRTPLGRMARADDFHGALVFLASEASRYVTGSVLVVDGGFTAW